LLVLFFLFFLTHWLFVDRTQEKTFSPEAEPFAQSVLCRNVVNDAPVEVDSVFQMGPSRIYVLSSWKRQLPEENSLQHIWFLGGDTILRTPCPPHRDVCFSSLTQKVIRPGDWSVDLVQGRTLLSSRQFRVEDPSLW
jgi:hypothetical protein